MKKKNPIAKELRTSKFKTRIVKAKKGKFMCAPRKLEAGAMSMPTRKK